MRIFFTRLLRHVFGALFFIFIFHSNGIPLFWRPFIFPGKEISPLSSLSLVGAVEVHCWRLLVYSIWLHIFWGPVPRRSTSLPCWLGPVLARWRAALSLLGASRFILYSSQLNVPTRLNKAKNSREDQQRSNSVGYAPRSCRSAD